MAKLKLGGAWSGILEVELEVWTVPMLREEVAKQSGSGPETISLICAGKLLKDGDGTQKLIELGVKNNAKILVSRVSPDQGKELLAEEERSIRLSRLKAAAISLSQRHTDGSLPLDNFNLEVENQSGENVKLGSETDQRAMMMGLVLHTRAKVLISEEKYKDALEVLTMGEEAFSLCNSKAIELIDNVPLLQLDMVWCYFMLRDITSLSVAGLRLAKARGGIERAHGKESSRLRILQGGRFPEIALHLRMELLEGVVAYYSGQFENSRNALTSAQAKYLQLQVSEEAVVLLISMGYNERDAKRALRMSNQEVETAVDFLVEEKAKKERKRAEDILREKEIKEQKVYGVTPQGKAVDLQSLNMLVSIGFEKVLCAEALRRNENDTQKALDDLTNPEINSTIQSDIEAKKNKRRRKAEATIEEIMSMGFSRERVAEALRKYGTKEQAVNHLLGYPDNDGGGPSREEEDVEMEEEKLTRELYKRDAYSDYDIEVTKEGEAINEYLALLTSSKNAEKASSSH